uniref:Association with the SNF1 complex (ASC) domain-containing protein n=1 Tax=Kalmanozyma brasiliensis (strain GHG001) TaxID=1365824 RepID=V5ENE2_KALBG
MGNANSKPDDNAAAAQTDADVDPGFKRYHSHQPGHSHPSSQANGAVSGRPITDRPPSGSRLAKTASFFGRASSHDGATTPQRDRSRSGSVTGFLANQRRGSTTAANTTDTPATVKEGRELPSDAAFSPSPLAASPTDDKHRSFASHEISNPSGGSGIETTIRANPRTRRLTEGITLPASPGGFDPRHYVSPHPTPSVATQAHYASGLPSHHASVGVSSGLRVSSSGLEAQAAPASSLRGSEPQQVPSATSRAPTRHPLFGVAGTSLFPNIGISIGTNPAASPPMGGSSPVLSSQPLNMGEGGDEPEGSQRVLTALPSYLKIPTAIPSSHVSPSSPPPASLYSQPSDRYRTASSEDQRSASPSLMLPPSDDTRSAHAVPGAGAAAAVLNTEDVLIPPGDASKPSSPVEGRGTHFAMMSKEGSSQGSAIPSDSVYEARAAGTDVTDLPTSPAKATTEAPAEATSADSGAGTDDTERESRSLERTNNQAPLEAGERAASRTSRTPTPTPSGYGRRDMTPTTKDEVNGLRSLSPASGPLNSAKPTRSDRARPEGHRTPSATGSTGQASQPTTPVSAKFAPHPHHSHSAASQQHPALMPIVITWRAGGREVFVTGTFANEWRSKILLHKSKRDHTCVLHLPPGTHRLKFIVDDRWRVSRDLPTATDGDGNLVNYVEIPNVGPAHPGPLSAPGEDLPGADADPGRSERNSKIDSKKTTMNLIEEARKAEAMRYGLDDLFDDDGTDQEETWTSEIPAALIDAQEVEEAQREAEESGQHSRHGSEGSAAALPHPPALPRQLEKVILNSSPANPSNGTTTAGSTVDDNSILPAPNHVVLNHLTASSIKGGVLAVGTTTRYKRKYVTTVYYRPVQV